MIKEHQRKAKDLLEATWAESEFDQVTTNQMLQLAKTLAEPMGNFPNTDPTYESAWVN